jgi:hypothetical protein
MFDFFKEKRRSNNNSKELKERLERLEKEIDNLKMEVERLEKINVSNIQKIGLVRFNPFEDLGGDQSFSLALLDRNDNGIVITSLFLKEGNRIYSKLIENGNSKYKLTPEEKLAISIAKHGRKPNNNSKTSGSSNFRPH